MARARGPQLATELEALTSRVEAVVAGFSDEQWRGPCPNEGRSVAVVAFHVADGSRYALAMLDAAISGGPYPDWVGATEAQGAAINARQAMEHADVSVDDVLVLLRHNARLASDFLRRLTDGELDEQPSFAPDHTTADIAEFALLGHPRSHLPNLIASSQR